MITALIKAKEFLWFVFFAVLLSGLLIGAVRLVTG